MPVTNKLSGKASSLTFKGTTIPITKHTPTVTRTTADATDSMDYDAPSDMLWESQVPVKLAMALKVEGKYNTVTIPAAIIPELYSGNAAGAVVLTKKTGSVTGHGNFDITDYEEVVPVDDVVTYTCTLKLNGVFTPGS